MERRISRLLDNDETQTVESPCAWIDTLCCAPDGKQFVAGLKEPSLVIWDVRPME
jgi:hypothetical protein